MPIDFDQQQEPHFRCINSHLPSHREGGRPLDTMIADPAWLTLVGVEPAVAKPAPGVLYDHTIPRLNLGRGQPVRAYRCNVCGYIEIYDAHAVDPDLWGP